MVSPKALTIVPPLFLIGGGLVFFGQQMMSYLPYHQRATMLWPVMVGLAMILLAVWAFQRGLPRWVEHCLERGARFLAVEERQLLCLLLTFPVVMLVPLAAGDWGKMLCPWLAVSTWLVAIGLAVVGGWNAATPLRWPSIHRVALIVGLTGFALLLRGTWTERIPILLTGDEGSAGIFAAAFLRGEVNNIFISGWYAFPALYFSIPSLSIRLLGQTTEALRLPSALAGALTVTATFFVSRAMFGKRAAWFAAFFLSALHFHVHFSRIGLNNIWDGLWYVTVIGALWYGWERHRRNAYLLAGLTLGISQYFYPSTRLILAILLIWVALALIFDRPRLKQEGINILFMLLIAAVVVFPLMWHYLKHPDVFMAPMNRVALTPQWLQTEAQNSGRPIGFLILNQIRLGFGAYTLEPLRAWYTPGVPILRPLPAVFFLIGLVWLLFRGRRWQAIPLLLWLLVFGFIGALSESTPAAQRYVAAAPVCAMLVGYGLSESMTLLSLLWAKAVRWVSAIGLLLAVVLTVGELYFYFLVYTPKTVLVKAHSNDMIAQRLAEDLQTQPSDTQVVFFGYPGMGFYSIPSIQYLAPQIQGVDIISPWAGRDDRLTSPHLLFVFLPHLADQIPLVQADYPDGELRRKIAADGETLYWTYRVSLP